MRKLDHLVCEISYLWLSWRCSFCIMGAFSWPSSPPVTPPGETESSIGCLWKAVLLQDLGLYSTLTLRLPIKPEVFISAAVMSLFVLNQSFIYVSTWALVLVRLAQPFLFICHCCVILRMMTGKVFPPGGTSRYPSQSALNDARRALVYCDLLIWSGCCWERRGIS